MFFLYILYSAKLDRYYTGHTSDLAKRMEEHHGGLSTYTSKAADWELVYTESYETREQAHKRELEIKKKKSQRYIKWLIEQQG